MCHRLLRLVPGHLRLVSRKHRQRRAARPPAAGDIGSGALLGGTGLSNPMKALAGIEDFKLRAERVAGGYVVSGVLPWVSNLGDGPLVRHDVRECGRPVPPHDGDGPLRRPRRGNPPERAFHRARRHRDLQRALPPRLHPRRADAGRSAATATRAASGLASSLLQTGMGLGAVAACIQSMRQCDETHHASNQYLPKRPEDFEEALAEQRATDPAPRLHAAGNRRPTICAPSCKRASRSAN